MTLLLLLACGDKDPAGDSASTDSGEEIVENTAPTAPVVEVTPADPFYGEALTCSVATEATDEDGDELTTRFSWTVDGEDAGIDAAEVPADTTRPWEVWECTAIASDGELDSDAATASAQPLDECLGMSVDATHQYPMAMPYQTAYDDLSINAGGAYTLESWFQLDSTADRGHVLFSKGDGETVGHSGNLNLLVAVKSTRIDWSTYSSQTGNDCDYLALDVTLDTAWHHLAVTIDTNTLEKSMFLDGTEIARCTSTAINGAQDGPFFIGAMAYGNMQSGHIYPSYGWDGSIDEVRFSSTVRYTEDFTPARWNDSDDDTIALWHMTDDSDASDNGFYLQTLGGALPGGEASTCD